MHVQSEWCPVHRSHGQARICTCIPNPFLFQVRAFQRKGSLLPAPVEGWPAEPEAGLRSSLSVLWFNDKYREILMAAKPAAECWESGPGLGGPGKPPLSHQASQEQPWSD